MYVSWNGCKYVVVGDCVCVARTIFDYIFSDNICLSYMNKEKNNFGHKFPLPDNLNKCTFWSTYNVYTKQHKRHTLCVHNWSVRNHSLKYVVNIIWEFYSINSRYTWFLSAFETRFSFFLFASLPFDGVVHAGRRRIHPRWKRRREWENRRETGPKMDADAVKIKFNWQRDFVLFCVIIFHSFAMVSLHLVYSLRALHRAICWLLMHP